MPVLASSGGSHAVSILRPPIGSSSPAAGLTSLSSSYSKYSSSSGVSSLTLPSSYRSRSSYDLMSKLSLSPTSSSSGSSSSTRDHHHLSSSLAFPSSSPTSSSSRSSSSSSTGSTGVYSSGYTPRYTSSSASPSSVTLTRFSRRFSTDYNDNDSPIVRSSTDRSATQSPSSRRKKYTFSSGSSRQQDENDNKSTRPSHLASGLTNLGNTCYMNAVLQALYSSDSLRSYVSGTQKTSLMSSMGRLFADMRSESGYTSPALFRTSFIKYQPKFRGYEQQDAQEFLRYLLNGLHDEVNIARRRICVTGSTHRKPYDPPTSSSEAWSQYKTIDDSPLIDMIAGQLSSVITCKICGNTSTCWDPFWDLSLPLPRGREKVNIDKCISAFEELEELAHDEKPICDRCKKPVLATKRLSIEKAPSILILHMKRFTNEGYKLSTPRLVVEPNLLMKSKSSPKSYSLLAAVCHHGSSSRSGHYTSYCRYDDRWFHFNDERVTEMRNMDFADSLEDSYILFYVSDSLSTSRL